MWPSPKGIKRQSKQRRRCCIKHQGEQYCHGGIKHQGEQRCRRYKAAEQQGMAKAAGEYTSPLNKVVVLPY